MPPKGRPASVGRLPQVHHDPFDRMLVAQARAEKLRIASHDRVFERYGLRAERLDPFIVRPQSDSRHMGQARGERQQ